MRRDVPRGHRAIGRRALAAWLAASVALGCPGPTAAAQGRSTSRDPPGAQPFREGVAAMAAGRYEEAVELLDRAWREGRLRNALWNLAQAQDQLGRPADAILTLDQYAADPRTGDEDRQAAATVRARLEQRAGRVAIATTPAGALLRLDGEERGLAPREIVVNPGLHVVSAEAPGYGTVTRRVEVAPGARAEVTLELSLRPGRLRVAAPPRAAVRVDGTLVDRRGSGSLDLELPAGVHVVDVSQTGMRTARYSVDVRAGESVELPVDLRPSRGTLLVEVARGAQVRLGDRELGRAPLGPVSVPPGSYRLAVELDGHLPWEGPVTVQDGGGTVARVTLGRQRGVSPWIFGIVAGIAVSAGVVGGIFLLDARNARDEYDVIVDVLRSGSYGIDIRDEIGQATAAADRQDRSALLGRLFLVGAGLAALAAIALLPATRFGEERSDADVRVGAMSDEDEAE
ncbi:MAG: PEGA domain-containing protein [Deltaproteobacteria bacterium]|nr:PEGA domain-containing protein [Deltaproteobacteria bacterium]